MALEAEVAIDRLKRLVARAGLPEVEDSTSHGSACLRVRGKIFASVRDADNGVHFCPLEQKDFLLKVSPAIYWQTDHFKGWPAVTVRLDVIGDDELTQRLVQAWRHTAPKRLAAAYDATHKPT
jgi:hypothetical protein